MDENTLSLAPLDRLMLFQLLPAQADFATVRASRELRERLGFTAAEIAEWDYREEDGRIFFENFEEADGDTDEADKVESKNADGSFRSFRDKSKPIDQLVPFEIEGPMRRVIETELDKMDKNKSLTENHVDLFIKFMGEGRPKKQRR